MKIHTSLLLLLGVPFLTVGANEDQPSSELESSLSEINAQRSGRLGEMKDAERRALELLKQYSSFADCGTICSQLTIMYSNKGIQEPEKVILFAEKALRFNLKTEMAGKIYKLLAMALGIRSKGLKGQDLVLAHKEIIMVCMRGIGTIAHDLGDLKPVEVPGVGLFHIGGSRDDPIAKAIIARREKQLAANKLAHLHNNLLFEYGELVDCCGPAFKTIPYDRKEIEGVMMELKYPENVIKETIERLEGKPAPEFEHEW